MAEEKKRSTGYHGGTVDTVISVEAVTEQAAAIAQKVEVPDLMALANDDPYLVIEDLNAGLEIMLQTGEWGAIVTDSLKEQASLVN